jgi:hypothetical protein
MSAPRTQGANGTLLRISVLPATASARKGRGGAHACTGKGRNIPLSCACATFLLGARRATTVAPLAALKARWVWSIWHCVVARCVMSQGEPVVCAPEALEGEHYGSRAGRGAIGYRRARPPATGTDLLARRQSASLPAPARRICWQHHPGTAAARHPARPQPLRRSPAPGEVSRHYPDPVFFGAGITRASRGRRAWAGCWGRLLGPACASKARGARAIGAAANASR